LHHKSKPIKVGNRQLSVPAGAAFGTGEHVTTAMCLRMLMHMMKLWRADAPHRKALGRKIPQDAMTKARGRVRSPALVVDLGTGTGILALAAKLLGAKKVIGLDNDPIAVSTARQNARLNRIRGIKFRVGDVKRWKMPHNTDVVTANLFSELLVEVIPQLSGARWLILSGILRAQERDVRRALTQSDIDIVDVRRRGKWVAMLAGRR
ncbi:MAG TPA: 50S ribosomal protein L11 methyltransferase, partial [Chthoniobacterales bacterium]|nr:50S ribosomal protein L11 methyltransferase [Chthoniobacterales bacterium]